MDRNFLSVPMLPVDFWSPSSQRAWIEIYFAISSLLNQFVALLAEGVDRNPFTKHYFRQQMQVALLAEGVDRNIGSDAYSDTEASRPPRRGRG